MRAAWPTAGSSPDFASYSSGLRAHRLLLWQHVEHLPPYRRLYWLHVESDSGSSIDGNGVTGGDRRREGH